MKKRILIIEDNEKNCKLERFLLETQGCEVVEAQDAQGGLAICRQGKLDAIVMDVRLPDMRATELVRILRDDENCRRVPIIFVTASVLEEDQEEFKAIPNSAYIFKPIDTRAFVTQVLECIRNAVS